MSPPTSPRPFRVVEIDGADGTLTPERYPRALYYADGGLVLLPTRGRGHALRMIVAEFAEAAGGRAVALGALGTRVMLRAPRKVRRPTNSGSYARRSEPV